MRYLFNGYLIFSLIFFSIEYNDWYENIQYSLIDVMLNITNNDTQCNESFIDHLSQIYMYSDIDIISDFHKEIECSNISDFDYYLFIYQLNNNSESISSKKVNILKFTDFNTKFSTGICIPYNCSEVIKQKIFKDNQLNNTNIKELLEPYLAIDKITYLSKENNSQENKTYAFIILIILSIYFAIRIIISFIGEYYFYENDDIKKKPINKDDSVSEEEKNQLENMINEHEGDEDNNNEKKNEKVNKSKESIIFKEELNRESFSLGKNVEKEKGFLFYFNLWRNFGIYNSKKETKWFKDQNLELINFFKSILLFLCVFEHQMKSMTTNPTRDYFNTKFYESRGMAFIKLTKYADICYCSLDGFILSYKFYHFYKHYTLEEKNKFYHVFNKFLLRIVPKILLYYFNFYFLRFFLNYYVNKFSIDAWQKYFFRPKRSHTCTQPDNHLTYIFNYHTFFIDKTNEQFKEFKECHKSYFIYHNEFYIMIIFFLMFLLSYNIQSKILDILFLLIIFCPYTIVWSFFEKNNETIYNINYFDGENYSTKYFYFFAGIYFIGILSGITYFHYTESTSNEYDFSSIPFSFLRIFSKFIYNIPIILKYIFIIFFCLIIGFFSFIYYHFQKDSITFKPNTLVFIIYIYEKFFIVLIFNLLLLLLLMKEESFLSKIGKISLIKCISRNSFTIFASYDSFIKLFYIVFDYQVCLNIADNLFIAFGEFTFIVFLSTLFDILFELPFRLIIINLTHSESVEGTLDKLIIS
jgi:hypothetical protein